MPSHNQRKVLVRARASISLDIVAGGAHVRLCTHQEPLDTGKGREGSVHFVVEAVVAWWETATRTRNNNGFLWRRNASFVVGNAPDPKGDTKEHGATSMEGGGFIGGGWLEHGAAMIVDPTRLVHSRPEQTPQLLGIFF